MYQLCKHFISFLSKGYFFALSLQPWSNDFRFLLGVHVNVIKKTMGKLNGHRNRQLLNFALFTIKKFMSV